MKVFKVIIQVWLIITRYVKETLTIFALCILSNNYPTFIMCVFHILHHFPSNSSKLNVT